MLGASLASLAATSPAPAKRRLTHPLPSPAKPVVTALHEREQVTVAPGAPAASTCSLEQLQQAASLDLPEVDLDFSDVELPDFVTASPVFGLAGPPVEPEATKQEPSRASVAQALDRPSASSADADAAIAEAEAAGARPARAQSATLDLKRASLRRGSLSAQAWHQEQAEKAAQLSASLASLQLRGRASGAGPEVLAAMRSSTASSVMPSPPQTIHEDMAAPRAAPAIAQQPSPPVRTPPAPTVQPAAVEKPQPVQPAVVEKPQPVQPAAVEKPQPAAKAAAAERPAPSLVRSASEKPSHASKSAKAAAATVADRPVSALRGAAAERPVSAMRGPAGERPTSTLRAERPASAKPVPTLKPSKSEKHPSALQAPLSPRPVSAVRQRPAAQVAQPALSPRPGNSRQPSASSQEPSSALQHSSGLKSKSTAQQDTLRRSQVWSLHSQKCNLVHA